VYAIKFCWHPFGLRTGGATSRHSSRDESAAARGVRDKDGAIGSGEIACKASVECVIVIRIRNNIAMCRWFACAIRV
jgi:hypothetical protein